MPSEPVSLESFLEALPSAAAVISPQSGDVVLANDAFWQLSGQGPGSHCVPSLILPEKTDCPLCQGRPVQPLGEVFPETHAAGLMLRSGDIQTLKVKHGVFPNGEVLSLLEPFSEDVALTQAHSDFVSTVSHEFRTPLTSIKGFADTLLRYGKDLPVDQQRRFISIIKDQADRLTRLVENLLTVSKLGAARMEMSYRPVPLQRLLEKVIQAVAAKGGPENMQGQRHFKLELLPDLPPLWADADKLEQILLNLIDNAVKYSFPGSTVTVVGRMEAHDPDKVEILISDEGVGIAAEQLPQIFTQFARIDNPLTREVEGTGLGLYITQSLTHAMGGEISVTSEPNQGSTFRLVFPVASAERQAIHRRKLYASSQQED